MIFGFLNTVFEVSTLGRDHMTYSLEQCIICMCQNFIRNVDYLIENCLLKVLIVV